MLLDEGLVVAAFADEQVHPCQQQRQVGAGLDRQPVLGLARRDREARVDHDHRHAPLDRLGELLHLRVVHVLAQVRADQHQAAGVADVGRLGRADAAAEGQLEADVARAAALRIRRPGVVDDAVALQHVLDEALPEAVVEQRDRLRAVLGLDLAHALGDVAEGLVPARRPSTPPCRARRRGQRLADAVRVVVRTDGAGAARAQPAVALRILRVALELPQLAVAHVGDAAAAPEAHLAEGGDGRHRAGRRPARPGPDRCIGDHCEPTAVAPKVAAETVRKRRRERCDMARLSQPRRHADLPALAAGRAS